MRFKIPCILLLTVVLATTLNSCSEIPENNDPVIGIWSRTELSAGTAQKVSQREEWIFNDVYLGRYHRYEGEKITIQSDFSWSEDQGIYTIEYPGLDRAPEQAIIKQKAGGITLETLQGEILAHRE